MTKKNGLVFLEAIEDAHHYKNFVFQKDTRFSSVDIISLNPNINAFLKKENIPCISSSSILSHDYYDLIITKCKILEELIDSSLQKGKSNSPNYYSNTAIYFLILIWRHFLWDIELVYQSLGDKDYKFISTYLHEEVKTNSHWIEDNQMYLGKIAERYADFTKCEYIPLKGEQIIANTKGTEKNSIYSKIFKSIINTFYSFIISLLLKKRAVLISSPAYNMDRLCLHLKQKNNTLIFVVPGNHLNNMQRLVSIFKLILNRIGIKCFDVKRAIDFDIPSQINAESTNTIDNKQNLIIRKIIDCLNANKNKLKYRSIYFGDLLINKIETDLNKPLNELNTKSKSIKYLLEKLRPRAVLSQMNVGFSGALGYYSSKKGIPSFLISHGSHVLHKNVNEKYEHRILAKNELVGNYSFLVAQSPLASEMILMHKGNNEHHIEAAPILWANSKPFNKAKDKKKLTITHAGTLKFRHQRRFIYETADEYVLALSEICGCLKNLKNINLIIKTRPRDYELTHSSLFSLLSPLPENVVFETSRKIDEVLAETDLLISFSSTIIEEALVNEVPVLLYGGNGRYAHIPVEPFSTKNNNIFNPVSFVNSKENLSYYFDILDSKYTEYRQTRINFNKYKHSGKNVTDFIQCFSQNLLDY